MRSNEDEFAAQSKDIPTSSSQGNTNCPSDLAKRLHDLVILRPWEGSGVAASEFTGKRNVEFLEPLTIWCGAMALYQLFARSKEDPSVTPVFEAYYNCITGEAVVQANVEKFSMAIEHVALLPQLRWGIGVLQNIATRESQFVPILDAFRYMSATFDQIKQLLDEHFPTMVDEDLDRFDEEAYLAANLDVASCVAKGVFSSGLDHFIKHGKREGRKSKPIY